MVQDPVSFSLLSIGAFSENSTHISHLPSLCGHCSHRLIVSSLCVGMNAPQLPYQKTCAHAKLCHMMLVVNVLFEYNYAIHTQEYKK